MLKEKFLEPKRLLLSFGLDVAAVDRVEGGSEGEGGRWQHHG